VAEVRRSDSAGGRRRGLQPHPKRRARFSPSPVAGAVATLLSVNLAVLVAGVAEPATTAPRPVAVAVPAPVPIVAAPSPPPPPAIVVAASTDLAAPNGSIPTFSQPGSPSSGSVGTWYGYSLVLPVVAQQPGWLQVRLPQRPNGSTTWVHTDAVALSSTDYYLVISLADKQLSVYQSGRPIMKFFVGVGTASTPTVTGKYFVAVHEPKADPLYGPVVLDLSAHSEAITDWEGSGDAIIAIHGPIDTDADARIGTAGARVSNGCIRMHLSDQARLSVIPTGTPVDIYP